MTSVTHRSFILAGIVVVLYGCGSSGTGGRRDASSGTGGNLASGGRPATGGTTAAGGAPGTGGESGGGLGSGGMGGSTGGTVTAPIGTGGIDSDACSGQYPNNPNCSGAAGGRMDGGGATSTVPGTGGLASTGGAAGTSEVKGTGGATSTGGVQGTGGAQTASGGSGGNSTSGSGGAISDGGGAACSCTGGQTTFECLCSKYSCTMTLSSFLADGGTGGPYSTLEEYDECNLVVVSIATGMSGGLYVFDRTTGGLVGRVVQSDVLEPCPFSPDSGSYRSLSAGQLPDASCVRSRCENGGLPAIKVCPDGGV